MRERKWQTRTAAALYGLPCNTNPWLIKIKIRTQCLSLLDIFLELLLALSRLQNQLSA